MGASPHAERNFSEWASLDYNLGTSGLRVFWNGGDDFGLNGAFTEV
jgi:hypothetical protein